MKLLMFFVILIFLKWRESTIIDCCNLQCTSYELQLHRHIHTSYDIIIFLSNHFDVVFPNKNYATKRTISPTLNYAPKCVQNDLV